MPYVFFRCDSCRDKLSLWTEGSPASFVCECGGVFEWYRIIYGHQPSRNAQPFDPVTLFRDPTAPEGEYRTPGWNDEPTPAGFERVEIRNVREWEAVTRRMSARGRQEAERAYNERQQAIDIVKKELRADLREQMEKWRLSDVPPEYAEQAAATLKFAEYALEQSERKRPRPMPSGEVVSHALEYDSSNREAWRDERTGWKGRRS